MTRKSLLLASFHVGTTAMAGARKKEPLHDTPPKLAVYNTFDGRKVQPGPNRTIAGR